MAEMDIENTEVNTLSGRPRILSWPHRRNQTGGFTSLHAAGLSQTDLEALAGKDLGLGFVRLGTGKNQKRTITIRAPEGFEADFIGGLTCWPKDNADRSPSEYIEVRTKLGLGEIRSSIPPFSPGLNTQWQSVRFAGAEIEIISHAQRPIDVLYWYGINVRDCAFPYLQPFFFPPCTVPQNTLYVDGPGSGGHLNMLWVNLRAGLPVSGHSHHPTLVIMPDGGTIQVDGESPLQVHGTGIVYMPPDAIHSILAPDGKQEAVAMIVTRSSSFFARYNRKLDNTCTSPDVSTLR